MKITICDFCGAGRDVPGRLPIFMYRFEAGRNFLGGACEVKELCEDCVDKIFSEIRK